MRPGFPVPAGRRRLLDVLSRCLLVVALGASASGCAAFIENFRPIIYGKTAKENYEKGIRSMKGESHLDAVKYFNYVRQSYPTSRWVPWAELGIADAAMGRQAYIEAIDGYKAFINAHPRHSKTVDGYCAFKVGEAYVKQIPSDWFLIPPSYEKDQGPVLDAQRELTDFLNRYGESAYADLARKLLADVIQRLADHELYVARFYLDGNHPKAAIWRLEYVVQEYPRAKRDAEVLLLLGQVYLKQDNPKDARDAFRRLLIEHPDDHRIPVAKIYLDYIANRFGDLPPVTPLGPRKLPGTKAPPAATPAPAAPDDDDLAPLAPDPTG
ncbi:MAG TPA: outer membrane protein assembly factor BamD [Pseudomonadota bacterium]|nr:outer membrane protein assembly factor BamD [Pseudomonadota bacterium]